VVGSQIDNLIFGPSFSHNLFFNDPNGHANPFLTFMSQELSNDIKNFLIQWLLTFAISL
jgi:hypothetical protein